MKSLRSWMILLILAGPMAGCGSGGGAATTDGTPPPRPSIPGELSPTEAKAKLREMEKNAPKGRRNVPPRPRGAH
jgi:hypothetical protein